MRSASKCFPSKDRIHASDEHINPIRGHVKCGPGIYESDPRIGFIRFGEHLNLIDGRVNRFASTGIACEGGLRRSPYVLTRSAAGAIPREHGQTKPAVACLCDTRQISQ